MSGDAEPSQPRAHTLSNKFASKTVSWKRCIARKLACLYFYSNPEQIEWIESQRVDLSERLAYSNVRQTEDRLFAFRAGFCYSVRWTTSQNVYRNRNSHHFKGYMRITRWNPFIGYIPLGSKALKHCTHRQTLQTRWLRKCHRRSCGFRPTIAQKSCKLHLVSLN